MTLLEVFDGLVRMASSLTQKFVLERVYIYIGKLKINTISLSDKN